MALKTAVTWEAIESVGNFITTRLKVADGWIVRVEENTNFKNFQLVHVTDPDHQWVPTDTDDA